MRSRSGVRAARSCARLRSAALPDSVPAMKLPMGNVADGRFQPCWDEWTEHVRRPAARDVPRILVRCARGHVHALAAPASAGAAQIVCPVRTCGWTHDGEMGGYTPPHADAIKDAPEIALPFNAPISIDQLESIGYQGKK